MRRRSRALVALVVVVLAGCRAATVTTEFAVIALHSEGVVIDASGWPQAVPLGGDAADDPTQRERQDRWLAAGVVPGPERYRGLAEQALRDLDALLLPDGAVLASTSPGWRYVWPRDAAFVAVALSRTGHPEDAYQILRHLMSLPAHPYSEGVFEARYLADGTGQVPDDRRPQLDGSGWVLWAVAEWYAAASPAQADSQLSELRALVLRCVQAIRHHVDERSGLPAPFPDYWETPESVPTLGTVAALLTGLRAAEPVLAALGEPPATDLVRLLERGLMTFRPDFPRRPGGVPDAAVAFLMPPFAPPDPVVQQAWEQAAAAMARPAGGLAPGASWPDDGVSWTPTTAVFALTAAAAGETSAAEEWLDWLDEHRTVRGALPEKVLWDGRPAAAAPLAWTCALVLLTLAELESAVPA